MFASYMYIIGAENADLHHYVIIMEFIGLEKKLNKKERKSGIQTDILGSTTDYTSVALALTTSGKNHFYKMNGDVGMMGW